ncbi:hypothetical protein MMPV_003287 [Pyropia vietnamensis]
MSPPPTGRPLPPTPPPPHLAAVALGAAAGGALRHTLSHRRSPWVVVAINIAGCGLLGAASASTALAGTGAAAAAGGRWARVPPALGPALTVGFCGGLTTFSTYVLAAGRLGGGERLAYLLVSNGGGGLAAVLGGTAVRRLGL